MQRTERIGGGLPLLAELGGRVRKLRLQRGLSLRALAEASGVSERFLSSLEAGRGNISILKLSQVARALGARPSALLREAEKVEVAGHSRIVALLGLRGAGKSTVGERLAHGLELPFFELDRLVERAAGLSIAELFALHGEAYYRRLELSTLRAFLREHGAGVLATGGGIVTHDQAFALLEARTVTVWLRANAADHWNRVIAQGDERPMAQNPRARLELRRLLAQREPLYARARHRIDTSRLGVDGSVEVLRELLRALHPER